MPVADPIERQIRDALRRCRPSPEAFEAGVRDRLEAEADRADERSDANVSRHLRTAASFLPLPLLLGSKALAAGAKSAPAAAGTKLLGYVALPAISLFALLASVVMLVVNIRRLPREGATTDRVSMRNALVAWWRRRWWAGLLLLGLVIAARLSDSTDVPFFLLVGSFVALALLLPQLSRHGLGTRPVVALICFAGLAFLMFIIVLPGMVHRGGLHLLNPGLTEGVICLGLAATYLLVGRGIGPQPMPRGVNVVGSALFLAIGLWLSRGVLHPPTQSGAVEYVESFDEAEYGSATWREWEQVATWARQTDQRVDWTRPRQLAERTLEKDNNPYVLGSAIRTGLLPPAVLARVPGLERWMERNLDPEWADKSWRGIAQDDGPLRTLLARDRLSASERAYVAARMRLRWAELVPTDGALLWEVWTLHGTLVALGHPLDYEAERERVHGWLRACHVREPRGGGSAGGFDGQSGEGLAYLSSDLQHTWYAVQLMRHFGVPDGIDVNEIRGFLVAGAPPSNNDARRWQAWTTRQTLDAIPEVTPLTVWDYVRAERALIALALLVLLCVVAILRAPNLVVRESEERSAIDRWLNPVRGDR